MKALRQGKNEMQIKLDDEYFKAIDALEVHRGDLVAEISILRIGDVFEMNFHTEGIVHIPCSICLDDMEQPINTDNKIVAKFGEAYSEDDDLVTVAEDEGILDVSGLIYEFIVLNIPIRHVHAPGKCDLAMIRLLQEHTAVRSSEEDDTAIDPRWAALKNLKL
jgi:uncharacterized metal-binding protein YceD (DUF177 family)